MMINMLNRLKVFLDGLLPSRQNIFVKGINSNIDFWSREDVFDYSSTVTYKYGDFIHLDLGCNVGSEQGGMRYGVVVEDSPKLSRTVVVIPIHGSECYRAAHKYEAYINKPFVFLTKEHHFAEITQIRTVSKIRINKKYGKIPTENIHEIKKVMKSVFKI
jgi:mRNA-degrading endonuclease toxin of MazEF toxin-antitoxin module